MPGFVQRVGDANAGGGVILTGEPTVLVNFRPIATLGSKVSPHPPCPKPATHCAALTTTHCAALTTTNSPTILVGFKPITTAGTFDTCGHPRLTGATTVIAGL
jgi:uncharacterized Zn-binding protein involved in type VI secretion